MFAVNKQKIGSKMQTNKSDSLLNFAAEATEQQKHLEHMSN